MTRGVEQFMLDLKAGFDEAPLSSRMRMEAVLRALEAELARTSLLDDWLAQFVDTSDAGATVDNERAFVSLFNVYDALGIPNPERLTFAAFGRAMTERGFPVEKKEGGRAMLRGCRLLRRKVGAPLVDPAPLVDAFLAQCCDTQRGIRARVRSLALHDAYRRWALDNQAEPLSVKRFSAALRFRGFDKLHSNGTFWLSIALRDGVADVSERPQQGAEPVNSASEGISHSLAGEG